MFPNSFYAYGLVRYVVSHCFFFTLPDMTFYGSVFLGEALAAVRCVAETRKFKLNYPSQSEHTHTPTDIHTLQTRAEALNVSKSYLRIF